MRVAKISRRGFAQMRVRMHQCVDTFLQNLSEDNMQAAGRHPRLSPPGSGRAGRFAGLGMKEVPAQCPLLTQTTVTPVCQDGLSEDLFGAFEAQLENDDDDSQVELALMKLEDGLSEELLGAFDAQLEKDDDSVSSPLLNEVRQGVRSRVRRPPGHNQPHDVLAVREPRQSTFRRILELFEEMLQRLQQRWRDALAWVQERAAACFRGLCRALEAFWSLVQSFCSSMGHAFRSVIQV